MAQPAVAERITRLARRQQMARHARVSAAVVHTSEYVMADRSQLTPNLLIALGSGLAENNNQVACNFIRLRAQPAIARAIANNWAVGKQKTADEVSARMIGELTAAWTIERANTVESVTAARDAIIKDLKLNPPNEQTILRIVRKHYAEGMKENGTTKFLEGAAFRDQLYVPERIVLPPRINYIHYVGWVVQGQGFNLNLLATQPMKQAWHEYHYFQEHPVNLPEMDFQLVDNWPATWRGSTDDEILSFYEMYAYYDNIECSSIMVASSLALVTA